MNDSGKHEEDRFEEGSSGEGSIIDAASQRKCRLRGAEPEKDKSAPVGIEFLADVPLKVNVVLAETTMPVGEILTLGIDSVVQLDKPSGDPVDIYVEKQKLGRGEVVVLQEKLRIRVLEITPPSVDAGETAGQKPGERRRRD